MADDAMPVEAARLQAFVGEWDVAGIMRTEGKTAAISGRWRYEPAADGWGVRGRLETTIEELGTLSEDELIGFDRAGNVVHLVSMNALTIRDHVGSWTAERELELVFAGIEAGREVTERMTITVDSPARLRALVLEHADGALVLTTELQMEAVSPRPA